MTLGKRYHAGDDLPDREAHLIVEPAPGGRVAAWRARCSACPDWSPPVLRDAGMQEAVAVDHARTEHNSNALLRTRRPKPPRARR